MKRWPGPLVLLLAAAVAWVRIAAIPADTGDSFDPAPVLRATARFEAPLRVWQNRVLAPALLAAVESVAPRRAAHGVLMFALLLLLVAASLSAFRRTLGDARLACFAGAALLLLVAFAASGKLYAWDLLDAAAFTLALAGILTGSTARWAAGFSLGFFNRETALLLPAGLALGPARSSRVAGVAALASAAQLAWIVAARAHWAGTADASEIRFARPWLFGNWLGPALTLERFSGPEDALGLLLPVVLVVLPVLLWRAGRLRGALAAWSVGLTLLTAALGIAHERRTWVFQLPMAAYAATALLAPARRPEPYDRSASA
jgi:hypothetical protein